MRFHVEIITLDNDPVKSQDFEIPEGSWQDLGTKYMVIGANVSPNKARLEGQITDLLVPVILYENGLIKIKAYKGEKFLWQKAFYYELPSSSFPVAIANPSFYTTSIQENVIRSNKEPKIILEQMRKETPKYGEIKDWILPNDSESSNSMMLRLGIAHVVANETNKPLVYYLNRTYCLRRIAIYLDKALIV